VRSEAHWMIDLGGLDGTKSRCACARISERFLRD
jgi:hypothetical protein